MITIPSLPNMGEMLKNYINGNRKYKSGIANWMGIKRSSVQAYLGNADIRASTLWRLSFVLEHDFFADLSKQLPAGFSTPEVNPLQQRIDELERQKKELELEVKILKETMELMGRK